MEGLTASVSSPASVPRLRVIRHATSPAPIIGEQDSLAQTTPRLSTFKQSPTYPDSQNTSEDESARISHVGSASRLVSASLPSPDSSTQSNHTHRLRAVLNRFDTPSRNPMADPRIVMPPSPSEPESDFDLRPAQAARASIKDLFKNALREPGDTPQKPKLTRRASFNAVASPKVNKSRRKSTSDEEREILSRRSHVRRPDLSAAESLDRLRLHLTDSMSSVRDVSSIASPSQPPSEALITTPHTTTHLPRQAKISISHTPSSHVKSHKDLEPFSSIQASEAGDTSQRHRSYSRLDTRTQTFTEEQTSSHIPDGTATATDAIIQDESTHSRPSRLHVNSFHFDAGCQARDANHQRTLSPMRNAATPSVLLQSSANNKGRVSPGAWPTPPPPGSRPSTTRSLRHSLNTRTDDGRSEDGNSSRSSSAISNAELRDRMKESEIERQHELERSWNRPRPRNTQSTSHSHEERDKRVHALRPASSLGHSLEHTQHNPHSPSDHDRPRSTLTSLTSSRSHHEESDEERDAEHERERNWNASHPKWGQHTRHHTESGVDRHHTAGTTSPEPLMVSDQEQLKHTRHPASFSSPPHGHSRSYSYNDPPHVSSRSRSSHNPNHEGSRSGSSTYSHSPHEEDTEDQQEWKRNWNNPPNRSEQNSHHRHPHSISSTFHSQSRAPDSGSRPHLKSRAISPIPPLRSSSARRSTPSSPLPSLVTDFQQLDGTGVNDKSNGISRDGTLSPRHDHTSSSDPWSSIRHSKSKINGGRSVSPSDQELLATDPSKRHRRTTTELSESMGPFPRQNGLLPSLTTPNESLFADESVPPPQTSTPTFKSAHLPDLSISPVLREDHLLTSPPSSVTAKNGPIARADADLARLQRAVAPNFTFPMRRSPLSSPVLSPLVTKVSTSPRQSTSANGSRLSSDEHSLSPDIHPSVSEEVKTPSKHDEEATDSLFAQQTPRFPGAFGTSVPSTPLPPAIDTIPRPEDILTTEEATPKLKPVDNLPPTHVQANDYSSIPPTPAPPGAYLTTPTPGKRKGILKVRFDGDIQTPEDVIEEPVTDVVCTRSKSNGPSLPSSSSSSLSEEDVPPLSVSPTRHKGLRHVDEYGRVRRFTEDGEEIMLDNRKKAGNVAESPEPVVADDPTMTPRRQAKMRQVDTLGNEVVDREESKKVKANHDGEVPETRRKTAVFSRLAKSLGELQDELAEEENALIASVPASGEFDGERMMGLATVSKAARVERNRLTRKLQLERHEEDAIADKVFVARNPKRDVQYWEKTSESSWWQRKWRLVIVILILELAVLYTGYRLAMIHAKQIWLKTHFDPFFPALYLHQSRPGFLSRFGSLPRGWSAFAISGAVQRVGVRGLIVGVSKRIWQDIWSWRLEPWEAWGSPAAGPPVPRPWPS